MKLLTLLLLTFSSIASAQFIKGTPEQVKKLLCRTWIYSFSMEDGKRIVGAPIPNMKMKFYPDYRYSMIVSGVERTTGTWCYNERNHNIEIPSLDGDDSVRIILLEKDRLIDVMVGEIIRGQKELPHRYAQFRPGIN